jgi:iron complex transport system substrate-binding protein
MISSSVGRGRFTFLLLAAIAAGTLLAGCGGDDDYAATKAPTVGASASAPAAAYPVKVTDMLGRSVEIKSKPTTVVAVSPTAVEFVYAAGGTVVGKSASVNYPTEASSAKEVGTAYQPNFEQILALKPDLVIADSIIHAQPSLRKPFEDLPVPVIFAGADSYQKVLDGLRLMGQVFNSKEKTDAAVASIQKAKDDAKKALAGKTVTAVALIADRDNTLYAAKPSSYAGDIMAQLGITNPAASQPDSGPFPGYTALAPEKLLEFNPEFVFAITPAPPPAPKLADLFPQIPPFKGLKAVTNKKVIDSDVQLFLQAPGPRVADAFKAMAAAVTAP